MADDGKGDHKTQIIVAIIGALGLIIVAYIGYLGTLPHPSPNPEPNPLPINDTLTHTLTPGNILYSNYSDMYAYERYLFGVCVALNDSIKDAQTQIPITKVEWKSPNASTNESIKEVATIWNHSSASSANVTMNVSRLAGVNLTGDGTFIITRRKPLPSEYELQEITDNNPGRNLASWLWWVEPQQKGSHTLFLYTYTVGDTGQHKQIDFKHITIDVTVIAPPTPVAPADVTAATNVTPVTPVEEVPPAEVTPVNVTPAMVANETENVTAPAPAAPANVTPAAPTPVKPTPGFEGLFAITGLMAVAYLVLGRKQ